MVNDNDDAIDVYTGKLDFDLIQDCLIAKQDKRWVLISSPKSNGCTLLLA